MPGTEAGQGGGGSLAFLLAGYRQGLALKARALKEAVARGLRSPLADDAA